MTAELITRDVALTLLEKLRTQELEAAERLRGLWPDEVIERYCQAVRAIDAEAIVDRVALRGKGKG